MLKSNECDTSPARVGGLLGGRGAQRILRVRLGGFACAFVAVVTLSCGNDATNPNAPTESSALSGTWSGNMVDSRGGPYAAEMRLVQHGTELTGTFSTERFAGTVDATLNKTMLSFDVVVPKGGVVGEPDCTMTVDGYALVTLTTLNGTYDGTNSCGDPFVNGRISLTIR